MDFTFTPEQEALREQAREFLAATPEPTWAQLAELRWTGVSIAGEDGGAGLSFLEEGARWTLAFGPLGPDLDTAEPVAIVGGDGIYELVGGEREVLTTTDESR